MSEHVSTQSMLRAVTSHRSFRFLWLAQIFSQLALNMLLFVLALMIYKTTGSNTAVSALFLSYGLPAIFFGMIAGTIVDRLDRRAVLMACDISRAVLVFLLFFLVQQVGVIYLIMFLNALINQLYVPSEAPTIPRLVPADLLVSANSLFSFTYYSSMGLGFILAGPLTRTLGGEWSLLVIAALFLFAALSLSQIPRQGEGVRSLKHIFDYDVWYLLQRVFSSLEDGVRYVAKSPALFDALLLLTGTQVMLAILGTLGPGFADRVLKIDVRDASWVIIGPVVAGILLGALWVGSAGYRYGARKLIQTGITAAGILLILVALTVRIFQTGRRMVPLPIVFPIEFLLFFLLGIANSFLDVPANSLLQSEATGSMRGRVYGMLTAAVGGVGILPVIVGGVLADVIGVGKVIFLLGLSILAYGIYRMRYNERTK